MPETDRTYRIFISAAEPSADAICGGLINALKKNRADIEFTGLGGPKMSRAGCRLLQETAGGAVMTYKALGHISRYYALIGKVKDYLKNERVDLVIVCDSPSFNFHIAKAAKKAGIKTLFYVAPQLWAWGEWRIGKLRKYCDKLCCILPFEEDWFRQRGVDAVYVGHPLLDNLDLRAFGKSKSYADFKAQTARIALMPGSREAEINTLWQPMQQIALRLRQKYPQISFITVAPDNDKLRILKEMELAGFERQYSIDTVFETARLSDFAIVASGSATVQVAAAGCPMVIMYQSSKILWQLLGKRLIKTKHLSLVNILAQKELVPEFMPYFTSIEPVVLSIENLLMDKNKLAAVSSELINLAKNLAGNNSAQKTAQIAVGML